MIELSCQSWFSFRNSYENSNGYSYTTIEGLEEIFSTINFYKFPTIFFGFMDPTISNYSNSLRSVWQGGTHTKCGESLCTLSISLWCILYLCNMETSRSPHVNSIDSMPYDLFGIIHGHVDMAHTFVNLFLSSQAQANTLIYFH